jgi:hypothetical protein
MIALLLVSLLSRIKELDQPIARQYLFAIYHNMIDLLEQG